MTCGPAASFGPSERSTGESWAAVLSSISTPLPCFTQSEWRLAPVPRESERGRWHGLAGCSAYRRDGNRPLELARKDTIQDWQRAVVGASGEPCPLRCPIVFSGSSKR